MLDGRHSPRLCELPPRVTRAPPRNVAPLLAPRKPSSSGPRRWADLGGWVVGAIVLAAVLSCGAASHPSGGTRRDAAASMASAEHPRTSGNLAAAPRGAPGGTSLLSSLDLLESRLLAGRERVAWWTAWKREPVSLGRRP
jgi:hypothetical protein